jgi:hypothetical protein
MSKQSESSQQRQQKEEEKVHLLDGHLGGLEAIAEEEHDGWDSVDEKVSVGEKSLVEYS